MKKSISLLAFLLSAITSLYGQTGEALSFNTGNTIRFNSPTNIPIGNSHYTIELWIKPAALNGGFIGWGQYFAANQVNAFRFGAPGTLYAYWWGNDLNPSTAPVNLYDGNWHHVATTFDGTTRKVYVDGCLCGQDTPGSGHNVPSTINFRIGVTCQPCGGEYYSGVMDEVRIWNYARTQCEINSYKDCEIPTSAPGLVCNFHFNQAIAGGNNPADSILTDASGYGNNGVLLGFALNGPTSNWVGSGAVPSGFSSPSGPSICASLISNVTCNGDASGAITVNVGCGTGPYSYDWAPGTPAGDGTQSVTGLTAGTWTCTVTDQNNGSTSVKSFVITQPPALSCTAASQTNNTCNGGSSGTAGVNPATGGVGPYTYNWSPGNPVGDGTRNVSGLTAGTWSCTVTDAAGCTLTTTFAITEPTAVVASSTASAILCNGGSSTVTVGASGGTSPYTGTGSFTEFAGTYTYTVTDANGCTGSASITITQPTTVAIALSADPILCNGGTTTVTVSASGGTLPYTGEGTFSAVAGMQTYMVTDANGCTATSTITLSEPTAISVSVSTVNVLLCSGDSTGSIDLTVSGGTGPYTFDWNGGAFASEDLVGIPAGTYTGILTDANGCTDGGTVTITEPPMLTASVNSSTGPGSCGGSDGSIDITTAGGTAGYTYLWTNSATTEDISGVAAGSYTCSVVDANGCSTSVSVTLNDPAGPSVTLTFPIDTLCIDDAMFILSGESPSGGIFSGPGVSGGMLDPLAAGVGMHTISYSYTDINGCTGNTTDSIYVDICLGAVPNSALVAPFTIYPNPSNGTFTLQLNAVSITDVMIYDAQGKLVYAQNVLNSTTQITIADAGLYLISVTTKEGQRFSQHITVTK